MKVLPKLGLIGLALLLMLAGCKETERGGSKTAGDKQYDVRGKVIAVNGRKPAVTLNHDDIPGLMKGMQMEFAVADTKLLEGIKVGDQVQGRLKKNESGYVITQLEKR